MESPRENKAITDWRGLAEGIAAEYAHKFGLEKPSLRFLKRAWKSSLAFTWVPVKTTGTDKWEICLQSRKFEKLFERDPEFAEVVLMYVIAHELGHLSDPGTVTQHVRFRGRKGTLRGTEGQRNIRVAR